ncbi:MAG: rhodanese-like domain-containing protein, partial [Neisseria sp.]|nr:rhodanese-like domain-containing protein [Neisseria sp.]
KNSSEKFVLLDIREENERGLTIAAAKEVHLPRGLLEFQAEKSLNENDKIVVYCRTGSRGVYASNQLRALGYRQVYNLKGGITAWMEAGYPVRTFNLGEVTPHNYKQKK